MQVALGLLPLTARAQAGGEAGQALYVAVAGDNAVALVNLVTRKVEKFPLTTGKIVSRIQTGGEPQAILIAPDGRQAYVTVRGTPQAKESSVFVLDLETEKIVDQIPGVGSRICDVTVAL